MPKPIDFTGQRFGRLTAVKRIPGLDKFRRVLWECKCDCGTVRQVAVASLTTGNTKSCGCLHYESVLRGSAHPSWKGGRSVSVTGYVYVYDEQSGTRRREHQVVMEQVLGRKLLRNESVHHKNGQRDDNRPENLELWSKSQPAGQRVEDKIAWCVEFLSQHAPAALNSSFTQMLSRRTTAEVSPTNAKGAPSDERVSGDS